MKKLLLIALCAFFAQGAFCVFPQKEFKKLMNRADSLIDKQRPKSAIAIYDQLLQKMDPQKESADYLWTLLSKYKVELENHFRGEDSVLYSLDSLKRCYKIPFRNLIAIAEIETYFELMDNAPRAHIYRTVCDSIPRAEWCLENYYEKIRHLVSEVLSDSDELSRLSSKVVGPYVTENCVEDLNLTALEALGNRISRLEYWNHLFKEETRETIEKKYIQYGCKESLLLLKMESSNFYHEKEAQALMNEAKGTKVEHLIKRRYASTLISMEEYDLAYELLTQDKKLSSDPIVKRMINRINKEAIMWDGQHYFNDPMEPYPNQEWVLYFFVRNCNAVKFDLYLLPKTFNKEERKEIKINKEFKLIKNWKQSFPPSNGKDSRKVALLMPPLPLGDYALQIGTKDENFWILFRTSSMALLTKDDLITVVDRHTGKPITNIPVCNETHRDTTDKMGCVRLPYNQEKQKITIQRGEEIFEQELYANDDEAEEESSFDTHFFTEAPLYKPGDTVRFKGIVHKSDCVLPNKKIKIDLFSYKTILRTYDLVSDDYGSVSGEFVIPQDYSINYLIFDFGVRDYIVKIQNYQTSQIEILMEHDIKAKRGDSIFIRGKVSTTNGFKVPNAKVTCTLYQRQIAEVSTNEDGFFTIGLPGDTRMIFSSYEIVATASTGHTCRKWCSISPKKEKIIYFTINASSSPAEINSRSGVPTIRMMDEDWATVKKHPFNVKIHTSNLPYRYPHRQQMPLNIEKNNVTAEMLKNKGAQWVDELSETEGSLIFDRDFESSESANAAIAEVLTDVGNYTITCCSKENKDWNRKEDWSAISSTSKESIPCDGIYLHPERNSYLPGEEFALILGSGVENLTVYLYKVVKNQGTPLGMYDVGNEQKRITISLSEDEKGEVGLYAFAMKENRVYDAFLTIPMSEENRQLTVTVETFRDKIEVGSQESWNVRVTDAQGRGTKAQLLAYMYNRMIIDSGETSFNRIVRKKFQLPMQFTFIVKNCLYRNGVCKNGFNYYDSFAPHSVYTPFSLNYDFSAITAMSRCFQSRNWIKSIFTPDEDRDTPTYWEFSTGIPSNGEHGDNEVGDKIVGAEKKKSPRRNFSDGGLFLPHIVTDDDGRAIINFIAPENITEWNVGIVAHTKEMKSGDLKFKITTSKNLIVTINKPRFIRETDEVEISARIDNLTDQEMECGTDLLIDDLKSGSKRVKIKANDSEMVSWRIKPQTKNDFFYCTIMASDKQHSDGERIVVPYLSNRTLVTETAAMVVDKGEKKKFNLKIPKSGRENYQVKLEVITNPQWLVLEQLPMVAYGANYNITSNLFYECAARYMASYVEKLMPNAVKSLLEGEKSGSSSQSLINKNEDVKQILFEHTQWRIYDRSTSDCSKRFLDFYDHDHLQKRADRELNLLFGEFFYNDSFVWSKDKKGYDQYSSLLVATGIGKLRALGAMTYLPKKQENLVSKLDKAFDVLTDDLSDEEVSYLYMRSFYPDMKPTQNMRAICAKLRETWTRRSLQLQGMSAVVLHKNGDKEGAEAILKSLLERKQEGKDGSIFWEEKWGNSWLTRPIETHALIVEFLTLTGKDLYGREIKGVEKWLIMNKKANSWGSLSATLEACYALLIGAKREEAVYANGTIKVNGKKEVIRQDYTQMIFDGGQITPAHGKLTVENNASDFMVATIYYQYMEDRDKVQSSSSELEIKRSIFPKDTIQLGDRRIIRLVITAKQEMDFVHVRDFRPMSLEPIMSNASHCFVGNHAVQMMIKNCTTEFFIPRLKKGTHVIEYEVVATYRGDFTAGYAEVQSLYAPEMKATSAGSRVTVQ